MNKFVYINKTNKYGQDFRSNKETNEELWDLKIGEIRNYQHGPRNEALTNEDKEQLVRIYNKYKHVFSDKPGNQNVSCTLRFKPRVQFNKKSYHIQHAIKK